MNAALEKLLFQFTGKIRLEEVSVEELERISDSHPYFSVNQFLLAKKLLSTGSDRSTAQVQRTALYFSNPLWLHYQLHNEDVAIVLPKSHDEDVKPLLKRVIEEEITQQPVITERYEQPGEIDNGGLDEEVKETEATMLVAEPDEEQYTANTTEEALQRSADEEKQKAVISSVLEDQLAEFKKPVSDDTPLIIETEPYHTVDYFASQGIKIDLSQPQDKLGTKLKKFTDWLKQMKTVQPEVNEQVIDPVVENMIQGIAKTSNETREIVTETMAQVLVQQGKTDKAIQLYIKLSFLNPNKSAYFAAKIEQLKEI